MTIPARLAKAVEHINLTGINPTTFSIIDVDGGGIGAGQVWIKDLTNGVSAWEQTEKVWNPGVKTMRILAYTPTHPAYGIHPRARESIEAALSNYSDPIDWVISQGDNPFINPYENVTHQHNKARLMMLTGEYDALLSIEADMIVPPDTIDKLIKADADIAYGLYVSRHKPFRWLAYKKLDLWGAVSYSLDYTGEDARKVWGKTIDVVGVGMGCTLIKADVLKQLRFRLHDGSHSWIQDEYANDFRQMGIDPYGKRKAMVCDDYLLAMDAQHYGYTQRCDTSIICGHIGNDGVYWPDIEADTFYRLET